MSVESGDTTIQIILGFLGAFGANIFFGSFGVPFKTEAMLRAKPNPLVVQSYKTLAVFLTCWLVLSYAVSFLLGQ
jgi:hypothetical protein